MSLWSVISAIDWIGVGGIAAGLMGVLVALRANSKSKESNEIAKAALNRESLVDARQREFRSVEWDLIIDEEDSVRHLRLTNTGDTDAEDVTVVLFLNPHREPHRFERIPAQSSVRISSTRVDAWMEEAGEHEVVNPGYRVHWSSPLGYVSDETFVLRDLGAFMD